MSGDLHYASLLKVSQLIKTRQASSVEVTQALLDRIARLDSALNSFLLVTSESALAEARQADKEIAAGQWRGPLHGVPLGLKDLLYTKGVPSTAGMSIHKDVIPTYDATAVARLKLAGAVTIGKLHMTEGATMQHHPSLPRPDNPWLSGYWTGVSSSGSGVAAAAGLCYGALGSDTGGSIRMPSAACGLSGIKPTWGRVSRHGVVALAETFDHIGPMARTVSDAAAILRVIAGADPHDPTALPDPTPDYLVGLGAGIADLTIGVDWSFATEGVDPQMATAFTAAVAVLESLGATIRPIRFPPMPIAEVMAVVSAEVAAAHVETYPQRASEYGPALVEMLEGGWAVTGVGAARGNVARLNFAGALAKVFTEVDVIATPTLPRGAPRWDDVEVMDMGALGASLMRFTFAFNMSGSPTLSLPCGTDDKGLPLSLQLIGRHLAEAVICRAGHAYQTATDHHTRHPALD